MLHEQILITPQTEFPSRLMEDVYGTLVDTAPVYRAGLEEFIRIMDYERDDGIPAGWGVQGNENKFLFPELFTGRGFCDVGTRALGVLLRNKYPKLIIDVRFGYVKCFDETRKPHTPNSDEIFHEWALLSDPETLDLVPVSKNIFTLDPTAKQVDPQLPFILYTHQGDPTVTLYNSGSDSLALNLYDLNVVKKLLMFSGNPNTKARQEQAFRIFIGSLKIAV